MNFNLPPASEWPESVLEARAYRVLAQVVSSFINDPNCAACFPPGVVDEAKAVLEERRDLERSCYVAHVLEELP